MRWSYSHSNCEKGCLGVLNETGSLIVKHQWSSRCGNEASEAVNRLGG